MIQLTPTKTSNEKKKKEEKKAKENVLFRHRPNISKRIIKQFGDNFIVSTIQIRRHFSKGTKYTKGKYCEKVTRRL
jgi:hypothetical protein